MLKIQVKLEDEGARASLAMLTDVLEHRISLHENMAGAVEASVRDHLRGLNPRSPNTSFYARAARSTAVTADGYGAQVSITHRGMALRYHGGRVRMKDKHLALPTANVPLVGGEERARPREMGVLAFLNRKASADAGTRGYLVEGVETTGKRSGKKRIVPKPGGKLLYVLRKWTDHEADPGVLPAVPELHRAARDAATAFLTALRLT
jgi:hypothetical protein